MPRKPYPSDLTDAEWEKIAPLLPAISPIGRPREVDLRELLNGIFYVLSEGCRWRSLPHDFPPRHASLQVFSPLATPWGVAADQYPSQTTSPQQRG